MPEKITLKAARVNAGLTQKEAGAEIGVDEGTIRSWEQGETEPKISQAYAIAELYGIPVDSIIFFTRNLA
ncbi:MAG: helix-turn-helix transcriptional regulator [Eubacterium sp.]|nr:helix-turn-helix transcriptional regulator [Eubacterium sp.]